MNVLVLLHFPPHILIGLLSDRFWMRSSVETLRLLNHIRSLMPTSPVPRGVWHVGKVHLLKCQRLVMHGSRSLGKMRSSHNDGVTIQLMRSGINWSTDSEWLCLTSRPAICSYYQCSSLPTRKQTARDRKLGRAWGYQYINSYFEEETTNQIISDRNCYVLIMHAYSGTTLYRHPWDKRTVLISEGLLIVKYIMWSWDLFTLSVSD